VGYDPNQGFYKEKTILGSNRDHKGYILEYKGIIKMFFHHFKCKWLKPQVLSFFSVFVWNLYFYESMINKSNYMQLCKQLKYGLRDIGCGLFVHF
jgi:hypothetical protein